MSKVANRLLLSSLLLFCASGDANIVPIAHATELNSAADAWFIDPLGEACGEAVCALCFFTGVWLWGKASGWKFGAKYNAKASKAALAGKRVVQVVPMEKPSKQVSSNSEGGAPSPKPSVQPRGASRQSRRATSSEADRLARGVRAGRANELPALIDASFARLAGDAIDPVELMEALFVASLRACAARRCFRDALALYHHVQDRIGKACSSTWSVLMWSAVESGDFQHCERFLERLLECGAPTGNDLVNVVKYCIHASDETHLVEVLKTAQLSDCPADLVSRNRAISLCTSSGATDLAAKIVQLTPGVPMDAIAHNSLMKGFSKNGDLPNCCRQYGEMRRAQILPSEMTFGILLDACIDARQLTSARRVFSDLRESGLPLNSILYTTFIKGLVGEGELDEAMDVLDEMSKSVSSPPDLITFSTLAKAHAAAGNVQDCTRLLDRTLKMGIEPDSVFFNTILSACSVKAVDPGQVFHMLAWLVKKGLKPSSPTLSVVVKALSLTKSWSHALDFLEAAPGRYGVWPDGRIYCQLAQACASAGGEQDAIAAYVAMVKAFGKQGLKVDPMQSARLERICAGCGQGRRAASISQALEDSNGRVGDKVLGLLKSLA